MNDTSHENNQLPTANNIELMGPEQYREFLLPALHSCPPDLIPMLFSKEELEWMRNSLV